MRVELPKKPLAFLGVRQWQCVEIMPGGGNRQLREAHAARLQALIKLLALFKRQAKKARDQIDVRVGKHGSNRL